MCASLSYMSMSPSSMRVDLSKLCRCCKYISMTEDVFLACMFNTLYNDLSILFLCMISATKYSTIEATSMLHKLMCKCWINHCNTHDRLRYCKCLTSQNVYVAIFHASLPLALPMLQEIIILEYMFGQHYKQFVPWICKYYLPSHNRGQNI